MRAGAKLSDADKTKLKAMNAELAELQTTFEQNVLKEKNASSIVVDNRADLAGLSDNEIAAAVAAAKDGEKGREVCHSAAEHDRPAGADVSEKSRACANASCKRRSGATVTAANGTRAMSFCASVKLRAERAALARLCESRGLSAWKIRPRRTSRR